MQQWQLEDVPRCWTGECLSNEDEIRARFDYVKSKQSRSSAKVYHIVEARDGYYAFVEMNGKYYATGGYPSLESLEGYIF